MSCDHFSFSSSFLPAARCSRSCCALLFLLIFAVVCVQCRRCCSKTYFRRLLLCVSTRHMSLAYICTSLYKCLVHHCAFTRLVSSIFWARKRCVIIKRYRYKLTQAFLYTKPIAMADAVDLSLTPTFEYVSRFKNSTYMYVVVSGSS